MLEQKIEKRKYKLPIQRTADLGEETVEQFMQRVIDENQAYHVPDNFTCKYTGVYGSLKVTRSNYKWCLKGRADYVGTYDLKGWRKYPGLSATYTGLDKDVLVIDVFKIHDNAIEETNNSLDHLEGCTRESMWGYQPAAVPVTLSTGKTVVTKMYPTGLYAETLRKPDEEGPDINGFDVEKDPRGMVEEVTEAHPETVNLFIDYYNLQKHEVSKNSKQESFDSSIEA